MNDDFQLIEIQGTGEKDTFSIEELNEFLLGAKRGIGEIFDYFEILEQNL